MMHIIKWIEQPEKRSFSWLRTIGNMRKQIADAQDEKPSASNNFIKKNWSGSLKKAKKMAEKEMGKPTETENLTWEQVFEENYKI